MFNWLYSRHRCGRFLLRIEDTDRARSTPAAIDAIFEGLRWLGLDWDDEPVFQSARVDRHVEAVEALLAAGRAYRCYASADELAAMREAARAAGRPVRYDGRWRDRDPGEAPAGVAPAIRLKAPQTGWTTINDLVQGPVTVANDQLDDMIILRADGTPTYMLAVVVDDHDMAITHVIRGDDHLTNAFRQYQLYEAFGWQPPAFAHIPLIHGADGAKLSKRHGALGVEAYREMGFLPEAMCNYLLRLGWSHGDDEIISRADAIRWFDLDAVGRAPARFDLAKLTSLNAHYIRVADERVLADDVLQRLHRKLDGRMVPAARDRILKGLPGLRERARTLADLADNASFYAITAPIPMSAEAARLLTDDNRRLLADVAVALADPPDWTDDTLEERLRRFAAERQSLKLRDIAQPLRAALTGSTVSPPIFQVMAVHGRAETLDRRPPTMSSADRAAAPPASRTSMPNPTAAPERSCRGYQQ